MTVKQKLIMVMGVQRSGTNALFYSLSHDPDLTSYNEAENDELYEDFFLRPESQIRLVLQRAPGAVLLKPNGETRRRSLDAIFQEFADYDLHIVWIYRDPVNVLYSFYTTGWIPFTEIANTYYLDDWNKRNSSVLNTLKHHSKTLYVLKYEDAVADSNVLKLLFRCVGIRGQEGMRGDSNAGRERLPQHVQAQIDQATHDTLVALDKARTFKPTRRVAITNRLKFRIVPLPKVQADVSSVAAPPDTMRGLHFWLASASLGNLPNGSSVTTWCDQGPHEIQGLTSSHAPRHATNQVGGYAAVRFGSDARFGDSLIFGGGTDWSYLYDGSPFTWAIVIRPLRFEATKKSSPYSVSLWVGAIDGQGPGFSLVWDDALKYWYASIFRNVPASSAADTVIVSSYPAQLQGADQWHVLICVHNPRPGGDNLSLWINHLPKKTGVKNHSVSYSRKHLPTSLRVGSALGDALGFAGDIAEFIVFRRALTETERLGLTNHLLLKYGIIPSDGSSL